MNKKKEHILDWKLIVFRIFPPLFYFYSLLYLNIWWILISLVSMFVGFVIFWGLTLKELEKMTDNDS